MNKKLHPFIFSISLALVFALMLPVQVVADDSTPPPPTEEAVSPPTEETAPTADSTPLPPTEEAVSPPTAETEPVADPLSVAEEPLVGNEGDSGSPTPNPDESISPDESVLELIEDMPGDTSVIVQLDDGEAEPLATQTAETAILIGDPIWCPDSVAVPVANVGGCTAAYPTLLALLNDVGVGFFPDDDGIIWITAGADLSASDLDFDGTDPDFVNWSDNHLTLQGGWGGPGNPSDTSGISVFSVPLNISNWNANVSIYNISVTTTNSTGLYVQTTNGDIELDNVSSSNNIGVDSHGAELEANAGAAGGSVTVTGDNEFSDNSGNGLIIYADGDVYVEGVTADLNSDTGVYIEADGDIDVLDLEASENDVTGAEMYAGGNVTVLGSNIFDDNKESGLYIEANGDIDLENISASANGSGGSGDGATLESFTGSVNLSGVNVFEDNISYGLYITAFSDIDTENITASRNGIDGASLNAGGNITTLGNNIFEDNVDLGLYIEAVGDVEVENLLADGNSVEIYAGGSIAVSGSNTFNNSLTGFGALLDAGSTVTVQGPSEFNDNALEGLLVYAIGDIYLEDIEALNNGLVGVFLDTPGAAEVVCSLMSGNGGYQLEADTGGYLTLTGTDFGTNIDTDLGADEDHLILISNGCFTYTFVLDGDDDDDGNDNVEFNNLVITPPLPVARVLRADRHIVELDCELFSGTVLWLENGDRAYVPCPIIDSARLAEIPENGLYPGLPNGAQYISAFILDIYANGQLVRAGSEFALIDFSGLNNTDDTNYVYVYWDGSSWVEVTDQTFPFMSLYFTVPEDMIGADLAIQYWDGAEWVELNDGAEYGEGRQVSKGGYITFFENQMYFAADVNFTGTFVLVAKQ